MTSYPQPEPSYHQQPPTQSAFQSHYPEVPNNNSPRAPLPPGYGPYIPEPDLKPTPLQQGSPVRETPKEKDKDTRSANRLRKACDNCSIRKVKCDEAQPCKACIGLEIECTFNRPSKRRGPPNRLAETLKKQKIEGTSEGAGHSMPDSPSRGHAAHALASISQQPVLSSDSICPWPVLRLLIDDYFLFIHPVIPIPHEVTFREMLERRDIYQASTFLALIASMVSCLTASFPRRSRQHLTDNKLEHIFPSSMSLIEQCDRVAEAAHGPPTHKRVYTVMDAIVSYLQGVTNISIFNREPGILYFKECLAIIISLGLHRTDQQRRGLNGVTPSTANINHVTAPQPTGFDVIEQEMARRVFWLSFASVKSLEQLGVSPIKLSIPPSTESDLWPPLPAETDDANILSTHIQQHEGHHVPKMVGFNININLFMSYDAVSRKELISGVDKLVDWEAQKRDIEESLNKVKEILDNLPPHFQLTDGRVDHDSARPPNKYPDPETGRSAVEETRSAEMMEIVTYDDARTAMLNIQRANIHSTQLSTRIYLVEKYFTLSDAYEKKKVLSPRAVAPNSNYPGDFDGFIKAEYNNIIHSTLRFVTSIPTIHMEPNGVSLISKVRTIATTLLDDPAMHPKRKGSLPQVKAKEYLNRFGYYLARLEKHIGASYENNKEDEEAKLRQWADLQKEQIKFMQEGGFQEAGASSDDMDFGAPGKA